MTHQDAEKIRLSRSNWVLGVLYIAKEDPRLIVRNLWWFGWTFNFGNPWVVLALPVAIIIFLSPIYISYYLIKMSTTTIAMIYVAIFLLFFAMAIKSHNGPD